MAATAGILVAPRFQAFDKLGRPLIGGRVEAYQAGSSTVALDTYSDPDRLFKNTWPVLLDDAGSAAIYISGAYYIRILDANGVLIAEGDGIADAYSVAKSIIDGLSGGSTTIESRVSDLESEVDDLQDQYNSQKDTFDAYKTSNNTALTTLGTNQTTALTNAISTQNSAMLAAVDALRVDMNNKIAGLQIKVGGLYFTESNANPASDLGYGSWSRVAQGMTLVSLSTNPLDPAWTKSVGSTYGEYAHALTTDENGPHSHTNGGVGAPNSRAWSNSSADPTPGAGNTGSSGLGTPHNNVQPSYVVNVWKRQS